MIRKEFKESKLPPSPHKITKRHCW